MLLPALAVPVFAESPAQEPAAQIHIDADIAEYSFDNQQFIAQGNAVVTYKDIILTADMITGNLRTGDIEAVGNVNFKSAQRTLTGESFTYNFKTDNGLARDASAVVDGIHFRGKELKAEPLRYTITSSRFTTCDREKPHYYLSARELIIEPDKLLIAKDVTMIFFGKRIFHVPKYTIHLGKKNEPKKMLPPIGISGRYGLFVGYEQDISDEPRNIGSLEVRLTSKQLLQGGFMYDRFAGKPIFLRLVQKYPYYGGTRSDLLLSRLPEVGMRFCYGEEANELADNREYLDLAKGIATPLEVAKDNRPLNVVTEIGFGKFSEFPPDVTSERADLRAVAWLDPIPIGSKTFISPGISGRLSYYSTSDDLNDLSFRLTAAHKLGTDSYASLTYITRSIRGSTPFEFDAVELRKELNGRLRLPLGALTLELGGRYNLDNDKLFDTEISIAKRVHCIEPKITWHDRFDEFSIGVGLVGF